MSEKSMHIEKNRLVRGIGFLALNLLYQAIAFIRKDFCISISYRLQFIFQFLQIFFSVTLIYFIGEMLGRSGKAGVLSEYRADYFSFALIGLATNSYLRVGLVTVTNDIRQIMNQGTLEAMCASPIKRVWLILCMSFWQFGFETVRVCFYFLTAIFIFGMNLDEANWAGAFLTLFLTIPIFLMLGAISCSMLIVVKKGDPINWIFSSVGALLAGTMFPVSVMPRWLRLISSCFPLTHSLEAMRRLLLTGCRIADVSDRIGALFIFIILLVPLTILINRICISYAQKKGAFSTY